MRLPGEVILSAFLMDPDITAREIVIHYHKHWDIEIAYDEIKTHQCAALKGQMPTTIRSKRPDLVKHELYAMLIMYNLIRSLIYEAASKHGKEPLLISFLDSLNFASFRQAFRPSLYCFFVGAILVNAMIRANTRFAPALCR